jgi:hypothetical protein
MISMDRTPGIENGNVISKRLAGDLSMCCGCDAILGLGLMSGLVGDEDRQAASSIPSL